MTRDPKENPASPRPFAQTYFHGCRVDLKTGDVLKAGQPSNYKQADKLDHVYFTATLDAAIWGAELASGEGKERIYLVEPMGEIENDPNLTDKRFPGNPTMSYRSKEPLRIVGEVTDWQGHSAEQIKAMKDGLARLREEGRDQIEN